MYLLQLLKLVDHIQDYFSELLGALTTFLETAVYMSPPFLDQRKDES